MTDYDTELNRLQSMIDELRDIRDRTCEPKSNQNPRYLGLSSAIAGINKAIDSMLMQG